MLSGFLTEMLRSSSLMLKINTGNDVGLRHFSTTWQNCQVFWVCWPFDICLFASKHLKCLKRMRQDDVSI